MYVLRCVCVCVCVYKCVFVCFVYILLSFQIGPFSCMYMPFDTCLLCYIFIKKKMIHTYMLITYTYANLQHCMVLYVFQHFKISPKRRMHCRAVLTYIIPVYDIAIIIGCELNSSIVMSDRSNYSRCP